MLFIYKASPRQEQVETWKNENTRRRKTWTQQTATPSEPALQHGKFKGWIVIDMICNICGHDRISRKGVIYVRKIYPHKGSSELVPVCPDCLQRVEAGLSDLFLSDLVSHRSPAKSSPNLRRRSDDLAVASDCLLSSPKVPVQLERCLSNDGEKDQCNSSRVCEPSHLVSESEHDRGRQANYREPLRDLDAVKKTVSGLILRSTDFRQMLYACSICLLKLFLGAGNPAKETAMSLFTTLAPKTVLEVGCGADLFAYGIKSPNSYIIRSDISRTDLALGKKIITKQNCEITAENLACDGLKLPFTDFSIGTVVSINMLHHLNAFGRRELCSEIHRILENYGFYLIVEILHPHRDLKGCTVHVGLHHLVRGETHPPFPELPEILSLLLQTGLKVVYLAVHPTWRGNYSCIIAMKEATG